MAYDSHRKLRFLFKGIILNVENDDKENITEYNVKREVTYALSKAIPKKSGRDQISVSIGGRKQFPLYEGEDEPYSDEELYVNEHDVVIRRRKKTSHGKV